MWTLSTSHVRERDPGPLRDALCLAELLWCARLLQSAKRERRHLLRRLDGGAWHPMRGDDVIERGACRIHAGAAPPQALHAIRQQHERFLALPLPGANATQNPLASCHGARIREL